jgi:hypothetical protein
MIGLDGRYINHPNYYKKETLNINEGNIKSIEVHFSDTDTVKLIYLTTDFKKKEKLIGKADFWKIKSEYRKKQELKEKVDNF